MRKLRPWVSFVFSTALSTVLCRAFLIFLFLLLPVTRINILISPWPLLSVLSSQLSAWLSPDHILQPLRFLFWISVVQGESRSKSESDLSLWFREGWLKPWFHGEVSVWPGTAQPWNAHVIMIPIFASRGCHISKIWKASKMTEKGQKFIHSHLRGSQASGCEPQDGVSLKASLSVCG